MLLLLLPSTSFRFLDPQTSFFFCPNVGNRFLDISCRQGHVNCRFVFSSEVKLRQYTNSMN
jgi:hypothetical protein